MISPIQAAIKPCPQVPEGTSDVLGGPQLDRCFKLIKYRPVVCGWHGQGNLQLPVAGVAPCDPFALKGKIGNLDGIETCGVFANPMPLIQGVDIGKGRLHAGDHTVRLLAGVVLLDAGTGVCGAVAGCCGVHCLDPRNCPVTGGADLAKPWAKTIFAQLHLTTATIKNQPDLEKYFQDAPPHTTL